MKQKDIFLESEGDAWFARNRSDVGRRKLPEDDLVLRELVALAAETGVRERRILEIGCGEGTRLAWLQRNLKADCYGIEPSAQAVAAAQSKGVRAQVGTADTLPFADQSFDAVIFGFCLYLCDREDLFRIASEADRVLRLPGWLLILDFFSALPRANAYHHRGGLYSYKMDYRTLFAWHPSYECLTHKVRHHAAGTYSDAVDDWVAISVLRKFQKEPGT